MKLAGSRSPPPWTLAAGARRPRSLRAGTLAKVYELTRAEAERIGPGPAAEPR
jgi:hypothetical protein